MSRTYDSIREKLPNTMHIPSALKLLFDRADENALFLANVSERVGTYIEFGPSDDEHLRYWLGTSNQEILERLFVFGRSGMEGSAVAFWLNDEGEQKIVHLGSGSGSTLTCVLGETPLDFIRLIAIGYDEICWDEQFNQPPNYDLEEEDDDWGEEYCAPVVQPNVAFQNWVKETFDTDIPQTASQIVAHPDCMGDDNPVDAFAQWLCHVERDAEAS